MQKQIAEEERVQRVALDLLTSKQKGSKKTMEEVIEANESAEQPGMYTTSHAGICNMFSDSMCHVHWNYDGIVHT